MDLPFGVQYIPRDTQSRVAVLVNIINQEHSAHGTTFIISVRNRRGAPMDVRFLGHRTQMRLSALKTLRVVVWGEEHGGNT